MKITALAPWFGSNRMLAEMVGAALGDCAWVGVPFAGGMTELRTIRARTIVVNDLHRHVINLARVAADPVLSRHLVRATLRDTVFHDDELRAAQAVCRSIVPEPPPGPPSLELAIAYFKTAWMGRSGIAGIDDEYHGRLCVRWNPDGGDSAVRYRSAARSFASWRAILKRCSFLCIDAFDFLANAKKDEKTQKKTKRPRGIYADPPFPGPGERYAFNCGNTSAEQRAWHERLAASLNGFDSTRIVCRFYDHPLIRELYPEGRWEWISLKGRKQSNEEAPEVLLARGVRNQLATGSPEATQEALFA